MHPLLISLLQIQQAIGVVTRMLAANTVFLLLFRLFLSLELAWQAFRGEEAAETKNPSTKLFKLLPLQPEYNIKARIVVFPLSPSRNHSHTHQKKTRYMSRNECATSIYMVMDKRGMVLIFTRRPLPNKKQKARIFAYLFNGRSRRIRNRGN